MTYRRNRILALLAMAGMAAAVGAETYKVQSADILPTDLTARTNARSDGKGSYCAVVRVQIPTSRSVSFEGEIVGDIKKLPGEYQIYMKPGSRNLSYSIGEEGGVIDFSDYGIELEERDTYKVVLAPQKAISATATTTIKANSDNIVVLVDGIPMGETPLTTTAVEPGKHVISVPNRNGMTMPDMTVEIQPGDNTFNLTLREEKIQPVKVEYGNFYGSDGNYEYKFGWIGTREGDKCGLAEFSGEVLVPAQYDYIETHDYNGIVQVGNVDPDNPRRNKLGLYDVKNHKLLAPIEYDFTYTDYFDVNVPVLKVGKQKNSDQYWGAYNNNGKLIAPVKYKYITVDRRGKLIICALPDDQIVDIYDAEGNKIMSSRAQKIIEFDGKRGLFRDDKGDGILYADGTKQYLPEGQYICASWGRDFTGDDPVVFEDVFLVTDKKDSKGYNKEAKYGLMNTDMKLIAPIKYDSGYLGENGIAEFKEGDNTKIINRDGKIILDGARDGFTDIYVQYAGDKPMGFVVGKNESEHGFYDLDGKCVIPVGNYDLRAYYDRETPIYVMSVPTGKTGMVYERVMDYGERIWDPEGEEMELMDIRILNKNLEVILELPDQPINGGIEVNEAKDGFIQLWDTKVANYGYIDFNGNILANCIYGYDWENMEETQDEDEGSSYEAFMNFEIFRGGNNDTKQSINEGLAIVNIGNCYGFINNKGEYVVPMIYNAITPFEDGVAYGRKQDGTWQKFIRNNLPR